MRTNWSMITRIFMIACLVCLTTCVITVLADDMVNESNSTNETSVILNESVILNSPEVITSVTTELLSGDGEISKDESFGEPLLGVGGSSSIGVFRPSTKQFILNTVPISRIAYGLSTDIPLTGDWDHDGKTEIGIFRPSIHQFILDYNNDGVADFRKSYGLSTDVPITGDWDADGYDEIGVFRPVGSLGQFILDYNNDGTTDYRRQWGLATDIPVPIDWNDDGRTDVAVWRPSTRQFIILHNTGSTWYVTRIQFGYTGDKPVRTWYSTGDTQVGVFRPSTAQFIINYATIARYQFGLSTDKPITGKDWEIPPVSPTTEILNRHNYWRSAIVGANIPNLVWSSTVATSAQNWANYLGANNLFVHSSSGYGENLAGGYGTWTAAIDGWASERTYFIYAPFGNAASTTGDWRDVGHYTQVIWKTTTQCGCGKAAHPTYGTVYVCQYNPPGNYMGVYPY